MLGRSADQAAQAVDERGEDTEAASRRGNSRLFAAASMEGQHDAVTNHGLLPGARENARTS